MSQPSTADNPKRHSRARLAIIGLAVMLGSALLILWLLRYAEDQARLSQERYEARLAADRQSEFDKIKNGAPNAHLHSDDRLLEMLARDPTCIKNVERLHFDMVAISPEQAAHVSRLVNLRQISLYDSSGADYVLENASELPIELFFFFGADVSHDNLRRLAELPQLQAVYFEQVLRPEQQAILDALPERITVEIGFPPEDILAGAIPAETSNDAGE